MAKLCLTANKEMYMRIAFIQALVTLAFLMWVLYALTIVVMTMAVSYQDAKVIARLRYTAITMT